MRQEWKQTEISYLKKWYNVKTISEIAEVLNRTHNSIQRKAQRLNLTDSSKKIQGTLWIKEEIEYLEKNYEKRGVDYIAKKLNRSHNSIKRKAQNMGLNAYVCEELHVKVIARCFDCDSLVVNRWIDKFDLPCRQIKRGQLLNKTIDTNKFWKWAEQHKDIIPWEKYDMYSILPQPSWVEEIVKNHISRCKNRRKSITAHDRRTVVRMKQQGYTYKEIALAIGRTVDSVKHILNKERSNDNDSR